MLRQHYASQLVFNHTKNEFAEEETKSFLDVCCLDVKPFVKLKNVKFYAQNVKKKYKNIL